ncbi:NT-3 growth factor receptor [Triplophysa tibetana]|uniref:NT-3 growth factor receptor n=1 Tax=Triplophysa tibetana TaxID=1572043 RepID=A0A5A9PU30_9TELE|nr:NT-3 growth factor receptor [Triplophysa tibetana]
MDLFSVPPRIGWWRVLFLLSIFQDYMSSMPDCPPTCTCSVTDIFCNKSHQGNFFPLLALQDTVSDGNTTNTLPDRFENISSMCGFAEGQLISVRFVWWWLSETVLEAVQSSMANVVLGEKGEEGYYLPRMRVLRLRKSNRISFALPFYARYPGCNTPVGKVMEIGTCVLSSRCLKVFVTRFSEGSYHSSMLTDSRENVINQIGDFAPVAARDGLQLALSVGSGTVHHLRHAHVIEALRLLKTMLINFKSPEKPMKIIVYYYCLTVIEAGVEKAYAWFPPFDKEKPTQRPRTLNGMNEEKFLICGCICIHRHIENWSGLQSLTGVDMELYTGLQRLSIVNCNLRVIQPRAFANNPHLRYMFIVFSFKHIRRHTAEDRLGSAVHPQQAVNLLKALTFTSEKIPEIFVHDKEAGQNPVLSTELLPPANQSWGMAACTFYFYSPFFIICRRETATGWETIKTAWLLFSPPARCLGRKASTKRHGGHLAACYCFVSPKYLFGLRKRCFHRELSVFPSKAWIGHTIPLESASRDSVAPGTTRGSYGDIRPASFLSKPPVTADASTRHVGGLYSPLPTCPSSAALPGQTAHCFERYEQVGAKRAAKLVLVFFSHPRHPAVSVIPPEGVTPVVCCLQLPHRRLRAMYLIAVLWPFSPCLPCDSSACIIDETLQSQNSQSFQPMRTEFTVNALRGPFVDHTAHVDNCVILYENKKQKRRRMFPLRNIVPSRGLVVVTDVHGGKIVCLLRLPTERSTKGGHASRTGSRSLSRNPLTTLSWQLFQHLQLFELVSTSFGDAPRREALLGFMGDIENVLSVIQEKR